MSDVPVWADPDPAELGQHLLDHHGYRPEIVAEIEPAVLADWHRADHKFCWGIKHKDAVDQVFIHHTHQSAQKRAKP